MMKNLKRIFLLLFLTASIGLQAQDGYKKHKHSRKKIHALKIAYITEKLNLTEKEAEKFWPIYNKFDLKLMKLRMEERYKLKKSITNAEGGIEALSEEKAEEIITKMLAIEKKMYETKKEFFASLKKVIPSKKIVQLQIAEKEFNWSMLRKLKKYKSKKSK
jgi:Spy/CpxP family protein refolding chaperone